MKINIWFALGALGIIVGSFLPWYTEVYSTNSQLEYTGMELGYGLNSLIFGGTLLLLAVFTANSTNRIKLWVEGLISVYMVVYGFVGLMASRGFIREAPDGFLGLGIWLLLAGAVLHLVAFLVSVGGLRFITRPDSE